MADDVRAFYEQHPYPRPIGALDCKPRAGDGRQRSDYHLLWPARPFCDDFRILVAGCGTAQAAKYAARWPRARVTGIDPSSASIGCTAALKRKHRLDNLELHELPLERATELTGPFDLIVCTGVLHHLPDPSAGLHALRNVLAPGGAMHLMVYAPYGRAGVYLLQDYARLLGIGPSTPEIRDLAASLRLLPPQHPLVPLLRSSPDFGTLAGLADALLHPQDRPYAVPELLQLLRDGGLRFSRWLRQAPYLPRCGVLASSPHAAMLNELPPEQQYAAAELFRGTMVRHSVIVTHDHDRADAATIRFDGDAWLDYVPIRLPDTIRVTQRLPAGAACVLINTSHTYTDLILPLDENADELFAAIDGVRSVRELARNPANSDGLCRVFGQLWCYDQVVFASAAARSVNTGSAPVIDRMQ